MYKRSGLLALALACSLAAGKVQAQCDGGYGGGYGLGHGYGGIWDIGRLYDVLSQNVPYYAAFPPVYYSVPVPRTYGYSPFAYPPGVMTPEVVEMVTAEEIVNPYVEPTSSTGDKKQADQVTSIEKATAPLVVTNPYVASTIMRTAAIEQ